jgi:polysaccharide biosynthesis protein PelF
MKIALTAEGTYPHQFGGVSVWCDQLIRGLPEYDFTMIPLVATGSEPVRWKLPPNVSSMRPIPLWGAPPSVPVRARLGAALSPRRRFAGRAEPMVRELIDVLLSPAADAQHRFGNVLSELFIYAQSRNLSSMLGSEDAVRMLSMLWRERWGAILPGPAGRSVAPTLNDAVTAMQLVEHALRPLSYPPVQADVVHAVTNGLGALPALAAKWWYGVPMIVTEHGVFMREQYLHLRRTPFGWPVKDLYLRFMRRVCTLGYLQADVITPGNVYNRRWEAQLGADIAKVRTVYNGVEPSAFPALEDEPDVPTISWAGRIDPIKDLSTLLRAFALVRKQIPQARLRIFGSPPHGGRAYLNKLRTEMTDLGLTESVTFEGRVPEIRDAYKAGHVVVLCSITEGFPYTLIEAMACGRACVATDVGGVSEALGADAGLIVPPRNPAALAEACLRLLQDDELRRSLGAAARRRALEHFTVDRAISAFDEMYSLLGTGKPIPTQRRTELSDIGLASVVDSVPVAGTARGPVAVAGPAPEPAGPPAHWIDLPDDEYGTVIMPKLGPGVDLAALVAEHMAGRTAEPAASAAPAKAALPPDQQVTVSFPVLKVPAAEAKTAQYEVVKTHPDESEAETGPEPDFKEAV